MQQMEHVSSLVKITELTIILISIQAIMNSFNYNKHYNHVALPKKRAQVALRFGIGSFLILMTVGINLCNILLHLQFHANHKINRTAQAFVGLTKSNFTASFHDRPIVSGEGNSESALEGEDCFKSRKDYSAHAISTPYFNLGFPKMGKF
jgi:hypothetical protein